MKESDLCNT